MGEGAGVLVLETKEQCPKEEQRFTQKLSVILQPVMPIM